MFFRPRNIARAAFALALAVALAPRAFADDGASPETVRSLESTLEKLAKEATPKTVCVKSYLAETGDQAGYGSGAIISADGYILTCSHVVDIAKRCEIVLSNGKTYPAKMLGKNRKQDYALVKIDASDLPFYETGDSSKLRVGDWVAALGHPGGPYEDVQPAFAAGRVTNLHRKLPVQMMDRFYDDGIQTDVPIFAGNSGGPLVSLDGKLVGLNGAIMFLNENAYAVPINEPMADLAALKSGEIVKGKSPTDADMAEFQRQMDPKIMNKALGRMFKNFGKGFGKLFGGENGENPLGKLFGEDGGDFSKLFKKFFGGGEKDGEKDGDQDDDQAPDQGGMDLAKIMKQLQKLMGGKDGENPFGKMFGDDENGGGLDLRKLMEQFQKMFGQGGDDEGDDEESDAPPPEKKTPKHAQRPAADRGGWLGIKGNTKGQDGVLVDDALKGSPADKAGIAAGDVIVAVDGKLTPDLEALQAAIRAKAPGAVVTLSVDRSKLVDSTLVRERVDVKVTLGNRDAGK
ncbi:trypsin-like peptidase domain-containing protein [bacterium]|nr:trypsin-like peptidase domain-containing protein [bacterium]